MVLTQAFHFFFKLLYNQFAFTYDWVASTVSAGMWKNWVYAVLPYLEGPRVLEIGFGPGHLLGALSASRVKAVGLDSSGRMAGIAVLNGRRVFGLDILCVIGYAQFLPFPDSSFDQIVCTFPAEYILESRTLAQMYRVLHPQGRLVILPTAELTGTRFDHKLLRTLFRLSGGNNDNQFEPFFSLLNKNSFSPKLIVGSLEKSNVYIIVAGKGDRDQKLNSKML